MLSFSLGKLPRIDFGPGKVDLLSRRIAEKARRILLITGAQSFVGSEKWEKLLTNLDARPVAHFHAQVSGEPSPELVDAIAGRYRDKKPDLVVAIGGGSAMDAGKAISAMLPNAASVNSIWRDCQAPGPMTGSKLRLSRFPPPPGPAARRPKTRC